jgi:hypothetical protein
VLKFKVGTFRQAHEKYVRERYNDEGINSLSLYCTVSYCPVLAAYWFCKEIDPDNTELTKRIENVKLFYGITEVEE